MEHFITEGDQFYATALRLIRGARESVALDMYIIQDDEIGRLFQRALAARARAGVRVRVVFDAVGSSTTPDSFWEELRDAGVEVFSYVPFRRSRLFRPDSGRVGLWTWLKLYFLRRNHRKILICDGRVAMTGGFNIKHECSRKYFGMGRWMDSMYWTDAPPVVRELHQIHLDSVRRARSPILDLRTANRKRVREAILYPYPDQARRQIRFLSRRLRLPGWPGDSSGDIAIMGIARALKRRLRLARRRIYLMFPYFVPYGGFMRVLERKARQGVDVRIYLSAISDLPWIQEITLYQAARLSRHGISVFLFHGREHPEDPARFNHAKVALVDVWAGLGSSNFDGRSFQLNLETFVWRHRADFLAELETFFRDMEAFSDRGDAANLRSGWRARLLYPFRRFL